MSQHGYLDISDPKDAFEPKRVRILRAHLEEDAGKSVHDEVAGKGDSLIDLNRTGTPLLEIVTSRICEVRGSKIVPDRTQAAAYVHWRIRLQHAGGKSACRCQRESAH